MLSFVVGLFKLNLIVFSCFVILFLFVFCNRKFGMKHIGTL